jgi:hypothetical protein
MKHFLLQTLLIFMLQFSYGQFPAESIGIDTLPKQNTHKKWHPSFKIGAQIGYAYRTAPIPPNTSSAMKNHLSKLSHNLCYGADFTYFFVKKNNVSKFNMGVGLKYNGVSKVLSSEITYNIDGSIKPVILSENIGIHYIGPFFTMRHFVAPNKHCVYANVGAGYIRYSNHANINAQNALITGSAIAFLIEIGYDFLVTKHFAIGVQTSMYQSIATYMMENVRFGTLHKENLSHLDVSLGFRFYR